MIDIAAIAETLDHAQVHARAVPQSPPERALSADQGYAVQERLVARRLARGERAVGIKLGLTSHAKMEQVGVREVIVGRLTDAMRMEEGGTIALERLIHPRIEPEIAFLLSRPLPREPGLSEALACVEALAPALEIIDSRYENFRFDLGDVIADNSSSAGFILGQWHPADTDIADLGIRLSVGGALRESGSSAAILGHPARALVAAARIAAKRGIATGAGDIVMAGAATAAVPLADGAWVTAGFGHLGRVQTGARRASGTG
ncbi:MAG: fumarylacetoacetate hydrolase family protein [Roseovarius sp.]|nr:fumarylacetoacetate hydrolase family protein [Roseovarius sp.]